jgi:hypothetical protein
VHLEYRGVVRLVIDPAPSREQIDESASTDQIALFIAGKSEECLVDLGNQAVRHRGQVAARRPIVELLGIVPGQRGEEFVEGFAGVAPL